MRLLAVILLALAVAATKLTEATSTESTTIAETNATETTETRTETTVTTESSSTWDATGTTEEVAAAPEKLCSICNCLDSSLDCANKRRSDFSLANPDVWPDGVQEASFDNNIIATVDRIPPLPELWRLSFRNNIITNIGPAAFEDLPQLKELDLSQNQLSYLFSSTMKGLSNLNWLDLSENDFYMVPMFNPNVPQLKELHLTSNPITGIYNVDSLGVSMPSLETLVMRGMWSLNYVGPGAFAQLTELRSLVLTGSTRLSSIHPQAFVGYGSGTYGKPALQQLILRDNGLRTLDPELLPTWKNLQELDLRNNLWECDCGLTWIAALEPIINQRPELQRQTRCDSPILMYNEDIFATSVLQYNGRMCWGGANSGGVWIALIVGAVVMVLLFAALIIRGCAQKRCQRS